MLVEYVDKLNNIGLYFETTIADQPATDQSVVTKKRVVECLQQIGQRELAGIIKNQGIMCVYAVVYTTYIYVYEPKMRHGIFWLHAEFCTIIIAVLLSCIKSLHVASLNGSQKNYTVGRISTHGCSTRTCF